MSNQMNGDSGVDRSAHTEKFSPPKFCSPGWKECKGLSAEPEPLPKARESYALIWGWVWEPWVISILRGLAFSATGMRRLSTPPS